ncbi:MAG: PAS domain S-box protein [Verrucomicrobiales bacterium]|nr:PAS domain S-box protein [Verrucomicrobiales bacterium]
MEMIPLISHPELSPTGEAVNGAPLPPPRPEQTVSLAASLVEASDDAIVGKTLDGKVFSWNSGAERLFGYRAAEIIGHSITRLIPPGRETELSQIVDRIRRGRSVLHFETVRIRKDGRPLQVQQTVSPVRGPAGQIHGMVVISRDITEIKRLQGLVLETAERVQRRIGRDLHDGLSQQLSGIAYLAHVLLRKLESQARPEAQEAGRIVELISEATEQARAVARGLLPVKPDPQGLIEALRCLARSVERIYPLTCWLFGDADLGLSDPTLATHLYRIAQEAVHNAIKHGHASQVTIQLQAAGGRLQLTVQDNGCGCRPGAASRGGMGMETMRYRAGAIGATLRWRARRGHGLRVVCSLPLPHPTRCLAARQVPVEPAAFRAPCGANVPPAASRLPLTGPGPATSGTSHGA